MFDFDFWSLEFDWNKEKNHKLIEWRKISFENVLTELKSGGLVNVIDSPTHNNQKCFLVSIDDYINVVPFVLEENKVFLKTIYPSRKHTKLFLKK